MNIELSMRGIHVSVEVPDNLGVVLTEELVSTITTAVVSAGSKLSQLERQEAPDDEPEKPF